MFFTWLFNTLCCCFNKQPQNLLEYIYVLKLENGKWYVGKTNNLNNRINAHKNGNGSEYTKIFKVISLHHYHIKNNIFDEDNTVKEYMIKYGIDSVRGGTYSSVKLNDNIKILLQNEINHANNFCFNCGSNQHYIKDCTLIQNKTDDIVTFGKYKGQPINNVPISYINWCKNIQNPSHHIIQFLELVETK